MKRNEKEQCRKAGSGQTDKAQNDQADKALREMDSAMDQELGTLAMDQDLDFDQKLEKMITRKMRKVAVKTAIIVVLAVAVVFLGISPVMNLMHYNPAKTSKTGEGDPMAVLDAYYKTTCPYVEVWGVQVEKEGFGCYTLNLDLMNGKKTVAAVLEMKRGRISITSDSSQCLSPLIGRFFTEQQGEAMGEEDRKTLIKEIEKLPDSSHLYLSLSNQKPQDVSALLKQTNDELELEWLQVYQPENEFQAGVGIYSNVIGPNYDIMPEELTAERLKEEYLKNLKLLKENQDAWKGLELYSGDSIWAESEKDQLLQKAISAAEKSPIFQTKNYCVSGTKKEILAFLQKGAYNRINVDNVQYSILT